MDDLQDRSRSPELSQFNKPCDCVAELSHDYPLADIILAADLNQLHDDDVVERTEIVSQPTRCASLHDRVFVSNPQLYCTAPSVSCRRWSKATTRPSWRCQVEQLVRLDRNARSGRELRRTTRAFCCIWRRLTCALDLTQQSSLRCLIRNNDTTHSTHLHSVCWRNFTQSALSP